MLKTLNLQVAVKVAPPKELGGLTTLNKACSIIYQSCLTIPDGGLVNLAVVVDADTAPNGGYQRTLRACKSNRDTTPLQSVKADPIGGLIYKHEDGLADFGLWIMPDNTQEGMLEDWLE